MFKVIFCKSIWNGESPESSTMLALLKREITLPFAPTPAVEISWGGMPEAIIKVRWDVASSHFVCNMKDECRHSIDAYIYDFDWLLKSAIDDGWSIIAKEELSPR